MLKTLITFLISTTLFGEQNLASTQQIFNDPLIPLQASILNITLPPIKKIHSDEPPIINAKASMAIDVKSGKILYEKNSEEKLPIASITKLMTSIIILEENSLNDVVIIGKNTPNISGVKIWLYEGEKITVQNLLKAVLIASANDAAYALAEYNAGNIELFIQKMNQKSQLLGMQKTHFANPMGFDDPKNYSTAKDLSILAIYALKKNFIRNTVHISADTVYNTANTIKHDLESTNKLLTDEYIKVRGIKTGNTDQAGLCFLALAEDNNGNEIITVVLNSPARFTETKSLISWIYENYLWP